MRLNISKYSITIVKTAVRFGFLGVLEPSLFYSGFFYPLYLDGPGVVRNSAEVISLIGFEVMFPEEEVNPIVMNGIRNEGSTYDFFSQKRFDLRRGESCSDYRRYISILERYGEKHYQ